MLVIFEFRSEQAEIGIDERHLRQRAYPWCSPSLSQKHEKRQEVWIDACSAEQPEASSLRRVLKVVSPGNLIRIEQVKNRSGDRLVASGWRKLVVRGQMPKRSSGHEKRTVGKRRSEHRRKVAVIHRE